MPITVENHLKSPEVVILRKPEKSLLYKIYCWGPESAKVMDKDNIISDNELIMARIVIVALKALSFLFVTAGNVGAGLLTQELQLPYLPVIGVAAGLAVVWGVFSGLKGDAQEKTSLENTIEGSAKLYACYTTPYKILEPVRSILYDVTANGAAVGFTALYPPLGCVYGAVSVFIVVFTAMELASRKSKHWAHAFFDHINAEA